MLHIKYRHKHLLVEADDLRILGQGRWIGRSAFQCRDLSPLNMSSGVNITHTQGVFVGARTHAHTHTHHYRVPRSTLQMLSVDSTYRCMRNASEALQHPDHFSVLLQREREREREREIHIRTHTHTHVAVCAYACVSYTHAYTYVCV